MRLHFPNWLPQTLARLILERTEHHFDVQRTNTALPIPTRTRLPLASHTTLSHRYHLSASLTWTQSPALGSSSPSKNNENFNTLVCARCLDPLVLGGSIMSEDERSRRQLWDLHCEMYR